MPGCSARFCQNRSDKGFLMHIFPRDPKRRAEWTSIANRKDWEPSNFCYLCEAHFEKDQYELHRLDGKVKLKQNAIPTIFHKTDQEPKSKPRFVAKKTKSVELILAAAASTSSSSNASVDNDIEDQPGNSKHRPIQKCKAKNCISYKTRPSVPLFPFPTTKARCHTWIQRSQNEEPTNFLSKKLHLDARLCAEHFDDSQFTDESKTTLVPDALPTIFPGHFVLVPMTDSSNQWTNEAGSPTSLRHFVKKEPVWENSSDPATDKETTLTTEPRLTYQQLYTNTSSVRLPSSLWAVHKGADNEFVAFVHATISESMLLVEKAIVFKESCRASVYFKGRRVLLGMSEVKTFREIESLINQLNSLPNQHSTSAQA